MDVDSLARLAAMKSDSVEDALKKALKFHTHNFNEKELKTRIEEYMIGFRLDL